MLAVAPEPVTFPVRLSTIIPESAPAEILKKPQEAQVASIWTGTASVPPKPLEIRLMNGYVPWLPPTYTKSGLGRRLAVRKAVMGLLLAPEVPPLWCSSAKPEGAPRLVPL